MSVTWYEYSTLEILVPKIWIIQGMNNAAFLLVWCTCSVYIFMFVYTMCLGLSDACLKIAFESKLSNITNWDLYDMPTNIYSMFHDHSLCVSDLLNFFFNIDLLSLKNISVDFALLCLFILLFADDQHRWFCYNQADQSGSIWVGLFMFVVIPKWFHINSTHSKYG